MCFGHSCSVASPIFEAASGGLDDVQRRDAPPPAKLRHSGGLLLLPRAPDRMAASSSQSSFTSFEKPAAPPAAGFFVSGVVISEIGSLRASTQSLNGVTCLAKLIRFSRLAYSHRRVSGSHLIKTKTMTIAQSALRPVYFVEIQVDARPSAGPS